MVVHPQSIVHSLVELTDGSMIAQLGITDMRLPIQYAFSYPDRWDAPVPFLDLTRMGALEFLEPAWDDFPCLRLAYRAPRGRAQPADRAECGQRGRRGVFPEGRLAFHRHPASSRQTMDAHTPAPADTLAEVRRVDALGPRTQAAGAGDGS